MATPSDVTRTQVFSFGGGVQSATIAHLVSRGDLPKPDLVVMADTGRESRLTWDYLDNVIQPMLNPLGLQVEIAPHDLATVDLFGKNGDILIPAFTTQGGNRDIGKLPTFCSNEWKQRVVMRWLRRQGVERCDCWLGFTLDEIQRVKPSGFDWFRRTYPLLDDLVMSRADCLAALEAAGIPAPPKSACWMCPQRTNTEWRHLRDNAPDEFSAAIALEATIRNDDPHLFLHRQGAPLADVDLDRPDAMEDAQCSLGFCMT